MSFKKYVVTILLIWMLQNVLGGSDNGHCSVTTMYKTRKIIPVRSNATWCSNIADNLYKLDISLCPDSRYLKFRITLTEAQDITLSLCYTIQSVMDWQSLVTYCYNIRFPSLEKPGQLDCWFPMEYIEKRPTIIASLNITHERKCHSVYGEISTGTLDMENSCTKVCDIPLTNVHNFVACDNIVTVSHDQNTVILSATFTSSSSSACNNVLMKITKQYTSSTEFLVDCDNAGPGFILITYLINDIRVYCQKKHDVHILCNTGSITVHSSTDGHTRSETFWQQHGQTVYLIITVFSLILIITIITTIVFVMVRKRRKNKTIRRCLQVHYSATQDREMQQDHPLIVAQ